MALTVFMLMETCFLVELDLQNGRAEHTSTVSPFAWPSDGGLAD